MKVLLINGSPHKEGCTYTALSEVAAQLQKHEIETEIFWIGNQLIRGCIDCRSCWGKGRCVFDDDSVNQCIQKNHPGRRPGGGLPSLFRAASRGG